MPIAVCLLAAVRDSIENRRLFDGLPSLDLGPLSAAASITLWMLRRRVVGRTRALGCSMRRGNPLALIEFGQELSPDQLAGAAHLPRRWRSTGGWKRTSSVRLVRFRLRQRMLLVAAAEPIGDTGSIWRAGQVLDFDEERDRARQHGLGCSMSARESLSVIR